MSAKTNEAESAPEGHVWVRVTKAGHDKIFTGETTSNAQHPFPRHAWGKRLILPVETAQQHEDNHHVEIESGQGFDEIGPGAVD